MTESSNATVKSLFDLPTYQRRLRHVRNITLRNLQCKSYQGKDIAKLQVFFTLHTDDQVKEFYRSEVITGSLNPTWQSFDICRHEEEIDIQMKSLVVRVWISCMGRKGHHSRKVEHPGKGEHPVKGDRSSKGDGPKLLVDWHINLSGLQFLSDKLQLDKYKYAPNMLIVGMFDKFFIAPEIAIPPDQDVLMVEPTVMSIKNSYTINSLSRIHTVLRAIHQMQASVKRVHRSIEDKLLNSQEKTHMLSTQEELLLRVSQMKTELAWQMNRVQHARDVHENYKKARMEKGEELKVKFDHLEKNRQNLVNKKKAYFETRESYVKENAQLLIRRKQLIGELTHYIYPLTKAPKNGLCICGVHLPNSEEFQGHDEIRSAIALGYTCHMLIMMSQILDFPLRYAMDHRGSRSQICDHIHPKLSDKDKVFPLYSKGKERFQFNYGVFLLNKNISQLRFYCGLGTSDLRLTLPNIKSMLELRLGVKFDSLTPQRNMSGVKDTGSLPSNEKEETVGSLASGGKNGVHDPANEVLENTLTADENKNTNSSKKENIPISLLELPPSKPVSDHVDGEDLFKPADENDHFFKLKTTKFGEDSCGNSSCDSYSEQTNGITPLSSHNYSNYSLSPEYSDNLLSVNQHAGMKTVSSKSSLQSCELSGEVSPEKSVDMDVAGGVGGAAGVSGADGADSCDINAPNEASKGTCNSDIPIDT